MKFIYHLEIKRDMNIKYSSGNVEMFEEFFRSFKDRQNRFKYREALNNAYKNETKVLYLFYEDVLSFDSQLARNLINDPEKLIDNATEAFKNFLKRMGDKSEMRDYFVRIGVKNEKSPFETTLSDLKSNSLSKLVLCKGKVVKKDQPKMRLGISVYECMACGAYFEIFQPSIRVKEPSFCSNSKCKVKGMSNFRFISEDSYFYDYQIIIIQENKKKMKVVATHDLVDVANDGDKVEVIGIYSTEYDLLETKKKDSLYRGMIEANNIKMITSKP